MFSYCDYMNNRFHYLLFNLGTFHICKAKGQNENYGSGKFPIEDCIFPFKQGGIEYKGCAPSLQKGKGPRCATEVDKEGNLQKWARCNKFCTQDPGMKIYHLFLQTLNQGKIYLYCRKTYNL